MYEKNIINEVAAVLPGRNVPEASFIPRLTDSILNRDLLLIVDKSTHFYFDIFTIPQSFPIN